MPWITEAIRSKPIPVSIHGFGNGFFSPFKRESILLRVYEFYHKDDKIIAKISAGLKSQILIPASDFYLFDKDQIKKLLPEFSLARKEKDNIESEKLKVESRLLYVQLEAKISMKINIKISVKNIFKLAKLVIYKSLQELHELVKRAVLARFAMVVWFFDMMRNIKKLVKF